MYALCLGAKFGWHCRSLLNTAASLCLFFSSKVKNIVNLSIVASWFLFSEKSKTKVIGTKSNTFLRRVSHTFRVLKNRRSFWVI